MAIIILANGIPYSAFRGNCNANFADLEERKPEKTTVLTKTNNVPYYPANQFEPATKGYADSLIESWISQYDPTHKGLDIFDRANHYNNISAVYVDENAEHRFVSDNEKILWNGKEPAIGAKKTAFNLNIGTIAGTVAEGNHGHGTLYEPKNLNIQIHIATIGNPHGLTKTDIGLANVDNTTDANKPISTATQTALNAKATITEVNLKRNITDTIFGDPVNSSYTEFEEDGFFRSYGSALGWENKSFNPLALLGGTSPPTITNFASTTLKVAVFSPSATNEINHCVEYPHKARLNSEGLTDVVISFHGHFYPVDAASGNVRIGLEYMFSKENEAILTSTILYLTMAVGGVAWAQKLFTFPDIIIPDWLSSQFHFRFFRLGADALDTYSGNLAVGTLGFHYQIDSLGSRQITVK